MVIVAVVLEHKDVLDVLSISAHTVFPPPASWPKCSKMSPTFK